MSLKTELIRKYNIPGPRYTSYPTVPFWEEEAYTTQKWLDSVAATYHSHGQDKGISLYVHLPFCESLCTFCGCHKRITKRHDVEDPYIATLLKEWKMYVDLLGEKPVIKELHLGGGTPTFFSPENLELLINGIFEYAIKAKEHDFGFEGHPNNTTKEHLQTLYDLGFDRVSFGVQDYDPIVQKAINRIQPFENVERVHNWAKEIGYTSISHDLVFGLPFQNVEGVRKTIETTNLLKPDRISFYSYAHVPWIKGVGQRGFRDEDIPKDEVKRELYELGKILFKENGYYEVGMDHFALPHDGLFKASKNGSLHRNFMGYTPYRTDVMIGIGVSSISDSWTAFSQNIKHFEEYAAAVEAGRFPTLRGHVLDDDDLMIRKHILDLMCRFETTFSEQLLPYKQDIIDRLKEPIADGLLTIDNNSIKVHEEGEPFIRNICMAFDLKLLRRNTETRIFSMTI